MQAATSPMAPPYLALFQGLMASEKSTLSRALGLHLGWPVIDKDDVNDFPIDRMRRSGPVAYAIMFNLASSLCQQGLSVICDSPLQGCKGFRHAERISRVTAARFRVIECVCTDDKLWRKRLATRKRQPSQKVHRRLTFKTYRYGVNKKAQVDHRFPKLQLNTVKSVDSNVEQVLAWLKQEEG